VTGYPLLYLAVRSTHNRLRVRLRRLKEPRYLIAFLLGAAYFLSIGFGWGRDGGRGGPMSAITRGGEGGQLGVAMMLFMSAAFAWIWPRSGRPALPFSRAEVQHLFTAPFQRRELVRYRVLRSLFGTLAGSAILTLIVRPATAGHALLVFLGLSVLMTTVNLHLTGVSLSRTTRGLRRRVPQAVMVGAVAVIGAAVANRWPDLVAAATSGDIAGAVDRIFSVGAAGAVLWPFRALARLPLAQTPGAFFGALPSALALLALNYIWVTRTDVPFEEGSAELAEKLDAFRRRGPTALRQPRTGRRTPRTPFKLAPHGRPETAILWKNLISIGRFASSAMLVRVAAVTLLLSALLSRGRAGAASGLTAMCLLAAALTMTLGPQMARSDLRQDLTALSLLKTWPMRGAAIVRAEVLAPASVLIAISYLALISAAVLSEGTPLATDLPNRWSWLIAALLVAPGIVLTQLLAQNGLAVTYPSWVALGARTGGVDVVGQRLLIMIVVMLSLVVGLLPAVLVAGVGVGIVYLLTSTVAVAFGGALAGVVLVAEAFAASEVIGAILDRSDISVLDVEET
jgi:hypothetical protein